MVVDDSVVARSLVARWLETETDIKLIASLRSGREAVDQVQALNPDVVVLDIEMPELDGISTLPLLLEKKPNLAIIVASTLTRRNAEITMKALSLGALDCIPKPDAAGGLTISNFRRDLIAKIRDLGARPRRPFTRLRRQAVAAEAAKVVRPHAGRRSSAGPVPVTLRPWPRVPPRVLLIGASTGGPQALTKLAGGLTAVSERAPILITQHMPPTFTTILAEHLARASGRPVREAADGEPIRAGHVYVAPGGQHMRVMRKEGTAVIVLDDGAPVHFCKPAVDPLFSSAAQVWRGWVLGLVLTGMGTDGTRGAADIGANGGSVIAQDEASSVVWGMPGSAAENGLCSAVLPLDQIAARLAALFTGDGA